MSGRETDRYEQPVRFAKLEEDLVTQARAIDRLRREVNILRSQLGVSARRSASSRKRRVSRRALVRGAAAGVAGIAAAGFAAPAEASEAERELTRSNVVVRGGTGIGFDVKSFTYYAGGNFQGRGIGVVGHVHDEGGVYNDGTGVYGLSGSGRAIFGWAGEGIGGYFDGGSAPVRLVPSKTPGAPTSGQHYQGEIVIDSSGIPYVCIDGDGRELGAWQPIGNLRHYPRPRRVFDEAVREGSHFAAVAVTEPGPDGVPSAVPAGASAGYAAVQADQPGQLIFYAAGTPEPATANWAKDGTAGVLALTYMFIPLSSDGAFSLRSRLTGHVYVDVWGYLL